MTVFERRWITPAECALYLGGMHVKSIYSLVRQHKIPATAAPSVRGQGVRRRVLIDRQELDRLLEKGLVPVVEAPSLDRRRR
jgi:hypothetical protein